MRLAGTARAHPNIALAKYWGKQDSELNLPETPSVAITLGALHTTTSVEIAQQEQLNFEAQISDISRVERWLEALRTEHDIPPLRVDSRSNFPSSTGLASSASGFAALIAAIDHCCELGLTTAEMCDWARRGSASAARSLHGGFVSMTVRAGKCEVEQVLAADDWDLNVVIAITATEPKEVSSTKGMQRSKSTSPFYTAWVEESHKNYQDCIDAFKRRDFSALAQVSEASCRQMHSVMLSSQPPLRYWNDVTMRCIEAVENMQGQGLHVFYTIDAGAQVKAICLPEEVHKVQHALSEIQGVTKLFVSDIGAEVQVTDG